MIPETKKDRTMIGTELRLGTFRVQQVRFLTEGTFIIRTERNHLDFIPGQRVTINLKRDSIKRMYSIYSGKNDPYLEFLIREVPNGYLTPRLKPVLPNEELEIFGPRGHFTLKDIDTEKEKLLFVSSGTGIAPFHSMVRSHPKLDYHLLHGVRNSKEAYNRLDYSSKRLMVCTSQEEGKDFPGRVTDYLIDMDLSLFDHVFLCGNKKMIEEVSGIVKEGGISAEKIHTEVYF